MKKIILSLILIISLANAASAQILWAQYSQSYPNGLMDKPSTIGLITAEREVNNSFWPANSGIFLVSTLSKDTSFQNSRPKEFTAITTFDTARAQFFLHGVNKSNANGYEFRVMERGGKVIQPWAAIEKFTDYMVISMSGMPQMAYLGGYKTSVGKMIIIDVRKKGDKKIIATSVVDWQPIRPIISGIFTNSDLNIFFKTLAHPWSYRPTEEELRRIGTEYTADPNGKNILAIDPKDNNLIFYLRADIYNKEQIEYELIKNEKIIRGWGANEFDNSFVWLKALSPGNYQINIRYNAQRGHVTNYAFVVKTPWYQSILFKIAIGVLTCAFMGFILFLMLNIKQKREAERELAKKTKLQLELKSIYAQLNPHFIFNALSSIQGLINKQDIKSANDYLSDFARLMRESLNNNHKDQIPLKQEMVTLETYLKLEQLRFGFKYDINIDKSINVYETEVPSLLLQPLIENAVKHGVSALQENGLVAIDFTRENSSMTVTITDNGSGFPSSKNSNGFGLKLTYDRIKLLNEFNKEQSISLEIKGNSPSGAKIELTFNNWFL